MSCRYYFFYCSEYHCGKCDKDVSDDVYYKYCRDYNYDECPLYTEKITDPETNGYGKVSMSELDVGTGSSCFLTSACVTAKGLPDDCYELQTLRHYRDNWLAHTKDGNRVIAHYYAIAPKIVEAISALDNSKSVYETIFDTMVLPCVRYIEQEKYQEAFELYKDTTLRLEAAYC